MKMPGCENSDRVTLILVVDYQGPICMVAARVGDSVWKQSSSGLFGWLL